MRWKNGIAEVYTELELPLDARPNPRQPLRMTRSLPIELDLSQAESAAIKPGEWLVFTGKLIFHPMRVGAVGRSTNTQQMYDVRHEYLGGGYLGTFTSKEYAVEIDGKNVKCRWATSAP